MAPPAPPRAPQEAPSGAALAGYLERLAGAGVRLVSARPLLRGADAGLEAGAPEGATGASPPGPEEVRTLHLPGHPPIVEHHAPGCAADHATRLVAQALLQAPAPPPGQCAWDLGCGTGVLCAVLGRAGFTRLRGSDVDARALGLARRTLAAAGLGADLRAGSLLAPFAGEAPEDRLVANLPQKPCAPGAATVAGPLAGPEGDAHLEALREALLARGRPTHLWLFVHSLLSPGLLARLGRDFDLRLRAWDRRELGPGEHAALRPAWRQRHAEGRSFLWREPDPAADAAGAREFLVGLVVEARGP